MCIRINHIKKSFGKKQVLKDISFSAPKGSCIGLLGSNGCGKSTLLSILAGVQSSNYGEFLYNGENLLKNSRLRAETVGYVPQGTPLIDELTAYDNLRLWYSKSSLKQELENGILKLLGIDEFIKVPVRKMSGGMKKRLSIGCAMAKKPPVLLLDEPTAALDLACRQDIFEYLKRYKEQGGILLLTTHDPLEFELCDEIYIIKNGVLSPFHYDGNVQKLVQSL